MIMLPLPVSPCEGKGTTTSDTDTVSTGDSPTSIEKQLSSCSFFSEKDHAASPSTPPRRSIFNSYWQKKSSSISFRDDDSRSDVKRSPKLDPSYLGVYSFAPSPLLKLPALSPISSTDSLTPLPLRPKSILRRHRSLQQCRVSPADGSRPSIGTACRPRSDSCIGPESNTKAHFGIDPPPFRDDTSISKASSKTESELKRQHSFVQFNPTITVRECVGEDGPDDQESNWFSEKELRSFMAETVNLCHSSAVIAVKTYSRPAVKKAYETAQEVGVKSPVLSSSCPEYRALFAEPVLCATDEDAIVHDGSKKFFEIMQREMQRVLIVDNSPTTLKLFRRHVLTMFPHVQIETAVSGEDALGKIQVDPKRAGTDYDLIIVEERLQQCDADMEESLDLTGSEMLRLVNEMETIAECHCNGIKQVGCIKSRKIPSRRSLKIGVSVSLGEDCESLRNNGGADLFWSKPPPKPSNGLRNQVMNALLSKRGKSVFICGC
mmetsp:Transcript_7576/g.17190  ORF Transcript_7576/g.17190 Transcript_7576/m.17190 type:complete len:491 (-) Transcript_7576:221-1693(-)|eukprot:CAMPEP_0172322134 /NCGR_PEP_ID=MMETSP1058-20130122/45109_1 /TAXON_ID=83371 /ORGANISM="Detonula confervacea, Strain CCMP 353" /LENGTH=490 /DNA_ID=CAMNT_0013037791 /DNA_START=40 /DNA_END=1512 /DNA_ORIENTATION=-